MGKRQEHTTRHLNEKAALQEILFVSCSPNDEVLVNTRPKRQPDWQSNKSRYSDNHGAVPEPIGSWQQQKRCSCLTSTEVTLILPKRKRANISALSHRI